MNNYWAKTDLRQTGDRYKTLRWELGSFPVWWRPGDCGNRRLANFRTSRCLCDLFLCHLLRDALRQFNPVLHLPWWNNVKFSTSQSGLSKNWLRRNLIIKVCWLTRIDDKDKILLYNYNLFCAYMSTANPQYLAEISMTLCLGSFKLWARGYV